MPPVSDIAVVLTVHREGRELFPTARALDRAIETAADLTVDVMIVRDRSDEATRAAVERLVELGTLAHAASISILDVDNGDLSASRNDGIAATMAPVIGVLDADNLPSATWLADAHRVVATHEGAVIAHPELIVTFGAKREVWPLIGSADPAFQPGWLAWFNPWDAFVLAPRAVFEQIPYRPSAPGGGFGPEDWAWNCDTLAAGLVHVIVPGTTLFYRATDHGLAAAHHASLVPHNELLRSRAVARAALNRLPALVRTAPGEPAAVPTRIVTRAARFGLRAARYLLRPVRARLARARPPGALPQLLASRREEWAEAHRIQPMVPYPSDDLLRSYGEWGTRWSTEFLPEQRAYWSAIAALPERIDVLVIAPWISTGGADLLTAQYIASIRRSRPGAVVALITTEPQPSTRLDLVDQATVFDLGAFELHPQFGVRVLGTLIAQLRPAAVHVVNSTLGYDMVDRYGYALRAHSRLFASTFVMEVLPDGTTWSFLQHRSRDFYDKVDTVLTDNERLVRHFVAAEGAPADAFVVHNAIVSDEYRERPGHPGAPLRVIWAARFDRQKRLDRLADIAERLAGHDVEFHASGGPVLHDDPELEQTRARLAAAGVHVHPPFSEGLAAISAGSEVFLMTSDREGLPITLLDAMSLGLAVVAPAVGDIERVVTGETGFLIDDPTDIDAYVAAIAAIAGDRAEARRRAVNAHALMAAEYSEARMDAVLDALPGYLPRREGGAGSGFRWFTDEATRSLLASGQPLTLVYTGSNGHSNFGDILQNKNILRYWSDRPDRTPVLFLPSFAASSIERIEALRQWFACPHIVFFAERRVEAPASLELLRACSVDAPVHVVGGGYLNAMWGDAHFAAIDAIATAFAASDVFFTGLQVDVASLAGFERLAARHRVPFIGLRDEASLQLVRDRLEIPAIDTFDDLTEVLEEWAGAREDAPEVPTGVRVAIHMNTSYYAGGDVALQRWRDTLAAVAAQHPDEVILLSAYSDERAEVRDAVRTMAALAEDFPFPRVTLLDTARAALDWIPGEGLPDVLAPLRTASYGLSSSYHTALMLTMLGVPTYLMGANPYFGQKAQLFRLPSLEEFLIDPAEARVDVRAQRDRRHAWLGELDDLWRA